MFVKVMSNCKEVEEEGDYEERCSEDEEVLVVFWGSEFRVRVCGEERG